TSIPEQVPTPPIPTTNKALIVASKGTYAITDLPFPALAHANEVIISNRAAGLNPIDYKSVDYNFCIPSYPWVTGREMAGVVHSIGSAVTNVKVGDHVWTSTYYRDARAGCFQHFVTVPAHTVLPLPPNTSFAEAATLGVAGLTAAMTAWHWLGIPMPPSSPPFSPLSTHQLPPPQPPTSEIEKKEGGDREEYLLIWGGSTITAQFLTQLTTLSSPKIKIIAITSTSTAPLAAALGAIPIPRDDLSIPQIVARTREIAGDNVTRAVDLVGPESAKACLEAMSRGRRGVFAPLAMMRDGEVVPGGVEVVTVEMKRFVLDVEGLDIEGGHR
ncbi:Trans-enoyl reductase lepG, partial [Lachnellula suecica]